MKPEGSVKRHQTLSSLVGSGHETTVNRREKDAGEEEGSENFDSSGHETSV